MQPLRFPARRRFGVLLLAVGLFVGSGNFAAAAPTSPSHAVVQPAATPEAEGFVGITPTRVLDTRPPGAGPVGVPTAAPIGPGGQIDLPLTSPAPNRSFSIPADAVSVLLNVTVDSSATAASFITVWPTGEPRPLASANNATPGLVMPNSVLVKLGEGSVSFYNFAGGVNLAVDLVGYTVPITGSGTPGPPGPSGPAGPKGDTGAQGSPGQPGVAGAVGPQGPKGDAGPSGTDGSQGPPGPAGPMGVAGATGPQGPVGGLGPQGPQGVEGPIGAQGVAGPDGPAGPEGTQGLQGPSGPQGPVGPQGPQGTGINIIGSVPTAAGLPPANSVHPGDAYITTDDGHLHVSDGTQWSDVGQIQGPPGPAGAQGIQGPQGVQGADGSQGLPGDPGPQGQLGPQGVQGPPGPEGPQGPSGPTGNPGPQGPAGPQGIQGVPGPTAVSADGGNQARLGSDNLIFVPGSTVPIVVKPTEPTAADYGLAAIPNNAVWIQTPVGRTLVEYDQTTSDDPGGTFPPASSARAFLVDPTGLATNSGNATGSGQTGFWTMSSAYDGSKTGQWTIQLGIANVFGQSFSLFVAVLTDSTVVFNGAQIFSPGGFGESFATIAWSSSTPFKMVKVVLSTSPIVGPSAAVTGVFQQATSVKVFAS